MPVASGLDATRAITAEMPEIKIVMLTVSESEQDLFEALKSGAVGYILKDTPGDDFSELIARVFNGEPAISQGLAAKILREFRRPPQAAAATESAEDLTDRESEVLRMVADGATNKEIAARLHLAESTANYHMRNILAKLHVKNRAEATAYAIQKGLIRRE